MKYKVVHSFLQSVTPVKDGQPGEVTPHQFKQGDHVTPSQLETAGHDVEFLKRNGAIEELEGTRTDDDDDVPPPPTTTKDATPGMATAPKGEPESRSVGAPKSGRRRGAGRTQENDVVDHEPPRVDEEKVDGPKP